MTAVHRVLENCDIKLIEKVKLTPSLYDHHNPDFRLPYRKEQDWEKVGGYVGLSATDARRRWTVLRDRYSRELRQIRIHPQNGDYGNNEFFRLMDFLRTYVRERRERRRYTMYKYDSSWDGSMDDSKLATKMAKSEGDEDTTNAMEDQDYEEVEETDQQNYKIHTNGTDQEVYPEFVEVEANEAYEEYVEQTSVPEEATCSKRTKTIIPIALPPQTTDGTTYTLSTATTHPLPNPLDLQKNQTLEQQQHDQLKTLHREPLQASQTIIVETEDDYFCKSISAYLRQLSRRHKIKAKIEMFQILEKYIELEENATASSNKQVEKLC